MKHKKTALEPLIADTLVTGGTGFLGRWLVAALTRKGREVAVVARGGEGRRASLAEFVDSHSGDSAKLHLIEGDLGIDGLGIDRKLEGVLDVYHLAAVFEFGMAADYAHEVNTLSALGVAKWAGQQPELRRVIHLAGYRSTIQPEWLKDPIYPLSPSDKTRLYKRHGGYEASKYESYFAMKQYCERASIPYTAVHPSGVIGSSETGETSQRTGIGEVMDG